jgi:hypothetical protein
MNSRKLTDKLSLSECTDGFYLYDYQRGMNLSMRAKTEETAFVESLEYYQQRDAKLNAEISELRGKIAKILEVLNATENED